MRMLYNMIGNQSLSSPVSLFLRKWKSDKPIKIENSFSLDLVEQQMKRVLDRFQEDLSVMRGTKVNPRILEKIVIKHESKQLLLSQVAMVVQKDPNNLMVIASERKWTALIDKALRNANMNLNPQPTDDLGLKIPIPKGHSHLRETLIKSAKTTGEKARVQIRSLRALARTELLKFHKISPLTQSEKKSWEQEIQTETDEYIANIDRLTQQKIKELEKL